MRHAFHDAPTGATKARGMATLPNVRTCQAHDARGLGASAMGSMGEPLGEHHLGHALPHRKCDPIAMPRRGHDQRRPAHRAEPAANVRRKESQSRRGGARWGVGGKIAQEGPKKITLRPRPSRRRAPPSSRVAFSAVGMALAVRYGTQDTHTSRMGRS